jgi:lysophospholipase L1-like esterase
MAFLKKAASIILFLSLAGMQANSQITGKVVCFGDSITNGAEVDGQSWVHYLSEKHRDINFIEAGQNGRKTADKQEIIPVLQAHPNADYFLIFLGVNDLKDGTPEMVEQNVKNVRWMIRKVQETNPETKIAVLAPSDINLETMAPVNVKKQYNKNTKRSLVQLSNQYQKLDNDESVQFWSLLDAVSPPNYVDGLHPNKVGQQQIAQAVWKGLKKLYP